MLTTLLRLQHRAIQSSEVARFLGVDEAADRLLDLWYLVGRLLDDLLPLRQRGRLNLAQLHAALLQGVPSPLTIFNETSHATDLLYKEVARSVTATRR